MTTDEATIDIDWGGEHVRLRATAGPADIQLSITDATADDMLTALEWAATEVRRFRAHLADGGDPDLFPFEPKPEPESSTAAAKGGQS